MSESWVEWVVRYQVRRSRQDERWWSGKAWAVTESSPVANQGQAQELARSINSGQATRKARVVRKTCEVVD